MIDESMSKFIINAHKFIKIANLIEDYKNDNAPDEIYQALINELLIINYTGYECFMKNLFEHLFDIERSNPKTFPLLVNNKVNHSKGAYWVPPTKMDAITNYFPLLVKWNQFENLKYLQTLVTGRNSYAHSGNHNTNFEQILLSFLDVQLLVRFLDTYYIKSKSDEFQNNKFFLLNEEYVKNGFTNISKSFENIQNSGKEIFPDKLKDKFIKLRCKFKDLNFCINDSRVTKLSFRFMKLSSEEVKIDFDYAQKYTESFLRNYRKYSFGDTVLPSSKEHSKTLIQNVKNIVNILESDYN